MAVKWFRLAADQGDAKALYNLGVAYYRGRGVAADLEKTFDLHRFAAEQGYPAAQYSLGDLYSQGEGVPQDRAKAYQWFVLAAAQADGDDAARYVKRRDEAAQVMPPEQIAEAENQIRTWTPKSWSELKAQSSKGRP